MRATSSCHRCRSRAGWRDRQVHSGCRSIDIASATYVNGRSKVALKNGGKRPFGFDVVGGSLVPNPDEQAALARGRALRDEGKSYRDIAEVWASDLGMPIFDAKSIQRMLARME